MSTTHFGNLQPTLDMEEHDGANNAKRVTIGAASVSLPVTFSGNVTAGMPGGVTVYQGTDPWNATVKGNVTLSDAKTFIGLVTVGGIGTITLADPKGYIGLVTIGNQPNVAVVGNVTLSDSKGFIGLVTVGGIGTLTLADPKGFIGLVTVVQSNTQRSIIGNLTLTDSKGFIGLVTVEIGTNNGVAVKGNVTLSDAKTFIGLVTVGGGSLGITGNVTLSDSKTFIGLATSVNGAGDRFIGLVTAITRNAGTNKSLVILPVGLGNNSLLTVAVPTNAQKINVTQLLLSSNTTTAIAIKSGVTYLTGNASLAVTLFPGGGFALHGAPDSPSWIGLPSGAMVIEKRDSGGTVANIGGHAIYFDE